MPRIRIAPYACWTVSAFDPDRTIHGEPRPGERMFVFRGALNRSGEVGTVVGDGTHAPAGEYIVSDEIAEKAKRAGKSVTVIG